MTMEISENFKETMRDFLEDLEENPEEHPDAIPTMVEMMEQVDVAEFTKSAPDLADKYQDMIWLATQDLVEDDPEIQKMIDVDVSVNFEANDSPMEGHLVVDKDEKTVRGGSGLLDNAELHITSDSDTLVGLLTGEVDPVQGFMSGQYEMDGPVDKGMQLAPIMTEINEKFGS